VLFLFYLNIHSVCFVQDFLEDLWGRIQVLSSNGWKVDSGKLPVLFVSISHLNTFLAICLF